MIGVARRPCASAWWMTAIPRVTILITVIAINLAGEGLNDALNPRLRTDEQPAIEAERPFGRSLRGEGPVPRPRVCPRRGPWRHVAIVGESGSGKSTVALALLRLIPEPPGRICRWLHLLFEVRDLATLRKRDPRNPGKRHRDDLPGSDDGAESGPYGRPSDRRSCPPAPRRHGRGRRLSARWSCCGSSHPRPRDGAS